MDGFLELNRHKLKFAFVATSLIFTSSILLLFTYFFLIDENVDLLLAIKILIATGLLFPIYIITLAYFVWKSKLKIRKKAYSLSPFDQLSEIGFNKTLIYEKSKWNFTEERKEGIINEFKIVCDVTRVNSKEIQFKAISKHKKIEKINLIALKEKFKNHGIYFDIGGVTKSYSISRPNSMSIQDLKRDLEKFTDILKFEGFEPA